MDVARIGERLHELELDGETIFVRDGVEGVGVAIGHREGWAASRCADARRAFDEASGDWNASNARASAGLK